MARLCLVRRMNPSSGDTVIRYSVSNSVAFVVLGILLLVLSGSMLVLGIVSLWSLLALVMALVAVGGGLKALATRKRFPMILSDNQLTFYRKREQVLIPVSEITRVWYNIHEGSTNEFQSP
jgi:hypothetical protein